MPIKFKKMISSLPEQEGFVPRTITMDTVSFEKVLDKMSYGSTATKADIRAVLENAERVCLELLSEGRNVDMGFFQASPIVKGSFKNEEDSFQEANNQVTVHLKAKKWFLKQVQTNIEITQIPGDEILPKINSFLNSTTGEQKDTVSSGNLCLFIGTNLKIKDLKDPNIGIFFVKDNVETRVIEYSKTEHRKIYCKAPDGLVVGEKYQIIVKNKLSKKIKVGKYQSEIQVV